MQNKQKRDLPINAGTLTQSEKLSAICIAAKEAGISYGKYCSLLTDAKEKEIYSQYAERLEKHRLHEIQITKK